MKKFLVYIAILISNLALAQEATQVLFDKANEYYRQEKYEEAVSEYENILASKHESAELYYNLGNAYYKLGKVAPAIFNLEKALLLNPDDEAIQTNLHFAQKMAIDDIKVVPDVGFRKIIYNFTSLLSFENWAWLSVLSSILILLFFIGYYFSSYANLKRIFFVSMFVMLLLLFVFVIAAFLQKRFDKTIKPAIVFEESVFVKAEPKNSAENAFELHEGTKVYVKEELDNWKRIQLTDKTEGWIKKEAIKELK